jgi:glycosyltransferase involved in cell wall biosynthesis
VGTELRRSARDSRTIRALMVGRLVPNKGHLFALEILREYRERFGQTLLLSAIGKKDLRCRTYYDSLVEYIQRHKLGDMFHYAGVVSREQLGHYYRTSDVLLCCSEHEGFCVPLVEAQSISLPVIAKSCGAVDETLGEGQTVLDEDPRAYVDAIQCIVLTDPAMTQSTELGYENYRRRFATEVVTKTFLEALTLAETSPYSL